MNKPSPPLWLRFPELYQDRPEALHHNVRVGAGLRPAGDATLEMRRNWWATTALRTDAVGERENQTWCLEEEERPGAVILGNLQLYAHLLPFYQGQNAQGRGIIMARHAEDFALPTDIQESVTPALVYRLLGADMAAVVQQAGIYAFVFPGAGLPKLPPQFLPSTLGSGWIPP